MYSLNPLADAASSEMWKQMRTCVSFRYPSLEMIKAGMRKILLLLSTSRSERQARRVRL